MDRDRSDDMFMRVYNYNTSELVVGFEAHQDYIRSIAVHPTQPYVVTCSDDMLIKLWDWERQWDCSMVFEGHSHYVMHVVFNPKDTNTFASASLDRTIKVWNVTSPVCNFTLEGHEGGKLRRLLHRAGTARISSPVRTISWRRFGIIKRNRACRHWRVTLTMFPRSASTQSCR